MRSAPNSTLTAPPVHHLHSVLPLSGDAAALASEAFERTAPRTPRTRVLVIGTHTLTTEALAASLAYDQRLELVGACVQRELVVSHVHQAQADVLLIQGAVLEATLAPFVSELHSSLPDLKIVAIADVIDEAAIVACVKAGAVGCFQTSESLPQLADLIQRAQRGDVLFDSQLLLSLVARSERRPTQRLGGAGHPLGRREVEVLQLLARGATIQEAAESLVISVHTARTHLRNAMAKLEVHTKLEAVLLALKEGLVRLP